MALARNVSEKMDMIGRRLEALESREVGNDEVPYRRCVASPFLRRRNPGRTGEVPNYEELPIWPDEDDESGASSTRLFAVSNGTGKLLREPSRKPCRTPQTREKFGYPKCPPTRVPKMDKIRDKMVKDRMSQEFDKALARLQALFLDALTTIIEEGESDKLSAERAREEEKSNRKDGQQTH